MQTSYTTTGTYTAAAGIIVFLFAHNPFFQVNISTDEVLTVLGSIMAIIGVVKQHTEYNKVATLAGIHPTQS